MFVPTGRFPDSKVLLTGECLKNTELTYTHLEEDRWTTMLTKELCTFGFELNTVDCKTIKDSPHSYRTIPPDDIFKSFGKNKKNVKETFMEIFETCDEMPVNIPDNETFSTITILYNEGISLVADKKFAEYPAGENLAQYFKLYEPDNQLWQVYNNTPEKFGKILDIPLEYSCILDADKLYLNLPITGSSVINGNITFELKIPVKIVNYLQWINDKISNPNAPVPYTEEVLHCTFTTQYNFK
jgi:hypothetical protein